MKKIFFVLALLLHTATAQTQPTSAITYTFSGGRLGDNLLSYLHAKYISYYYRIPLLYQRFPYSDYLMLDTAEKSWDGVQSFGTTQHLTKNCHLSFQPYSNTLYVIPYYAESREEHRIPDCGDLVKHAAKRCEFAYFDVDWNDPKFIAEIRQVMRPKTPLNLITPPDDCISVAVHVRKNGGGFDLPFLHNLPDEHYNSRQLYVDVVFPLKHPADDYYVEQIERMAHMFADKQLYVFLFTDDPDQMAIYEKYCRLLAHVPNISLDCRRGENRHDLNVLEDLFSMMNFDCLIRPDANLSIVASKLGDYKVVIAPLHHRWEGRRLIIDKVDVIVNNAPTKRFLN